MCPDNIKPIAIVKIDKRLITSQREYNNIYDIIKTQLSSYDVLLIAATILQEEMLIVKIVYCKDIQPIDIEKLTKYIKDSLNEPHKVEERKDQTY